MSKHKLKAKKGRPAKPYEDPRQTAIEARMRHTGLARDAASHERAGSVVGRLRLAGKLTEPQFEAAQRYLKDYTEAMAALLGPEGLERTPPGAAADEATEDYIAWATAATVRFRLVNGRFTPDELKAVERSIVLELEPKHLMDALVSALTRCAKGYGLISERAFA